MQTHHSTNSPKQNVQPIFSTLQHYATCCRKGMCCWLYDFLSFIFIIYLGRYFLVDKNKIFGREKHALLSIPLNFTFRFRMAEGSAVLWADRSGLLLAQINCGIVALHLIFQGAIFFPDSVYPLSRKLGRVLRTTGTRQNFKYVYGRGVLKSRNSTCKACKATCSLLFEKNWRHLSNNRSKRKGEVGTFRNPPIA